MNRFGTAMFWGLLIACLSACNPAQSQIPVSSTTQPALADPFVLAEPGPYFAGNKEYSFIDESRNGREIHVTIWYPAIQATSAEGNPIRANALPDLSGAPYPLILTEASSGSFLFQTHLATHGFVMARIEIPDHKKYTAWDMQMIDWPRDFVFVLDQIATSQPEGLENLVDCDHVGATGYSYGGDISLTLSGVRIDPEYYLGHCERQSTTISGNDDAEGYYEGTCSLSEKWAAFAAFAGEALTTSEDGLWKPVSDERIRAVMPMAPSGTWLYGERGLAFADRPVLIVAATEDEYNPYAEDTAFLFEHLKAPQKSLITFVGKSHMMIEDVDPKRQLKHFATAFFGYYLQGRAEYQAYFSEEFVAQFEDLYWGVYPGK